MYSLTGLEYYTAESWNIPFPLRLERLLKANQLGLNNVVYLYEMADTSTFRYRAYNMCQILENSIFWYGSFFFRNELEYLKKYLPCINAIVIIRYRWDFELDDFLKGVKAKNIPLLFDVDDLIYDSKYVPLVTNTLAVNMSTKEDYDYWFTYTGRIRQTALSCDGLITTNQFIKKILESDLKKPCYIMPNFFNREQAEASEYLCAQKHNLINKKEQFTLGYFSGTPSHINDFLVVAPELYELLKECNQLVLKIVGFMDLPYYMNEFVDNGKIQLVPLQNFIDLQKEIAEVDINLIPLQKNKFTNCKSELKYFEAGIVETISCATPTYVYQENIKSGYNGFLCDQGQWYATIKEMYHNGIRQDMVNYAKEQSYNDFHYLSHRKNLEKILDEVKK